MGKFKEMYTEGRDNWNNFALKKTNKRWSFLNTESGKRYFIKLSDNVNHVGAIQKFLEDIGATDGNTPKTTGTVNYNELASDVISGKIANIHVKSGNFDKLKGMWDLEIE